MSRAAQEHAVRAAEFIRDRDRAHGHDQALWFVRVKRDKASRSVPEWERLRTTAAQIKTHTMARLADYLAQFEQNARRHGAEVHWARHAAEHNQIVLDILRQHGATRVVKSKSMLTEECQLNPYLEQHGIEVVDTDLGERIMQLRGEPPSHIVLPAIHVRRQEVGDLFHAALGTAAGASDPAYLTEAARQHLRAKFRRADAGITGVNFAIAETGGIVVCTNEGNADLGVSLPRLHIACMGIEKVIPRSRDLGVFLRLLARSATGQPITTYTSHFHGPMRHGALHLVLVDNGRSTLRANPSWQRSLHCIRCGACLNTCPVYRRSGGHSYGATIPGPIGSVLGPARDLAAHWSLPYACSLCGSCTDVCPVKIDLHDQLFAWRQEVVRHRLLPWSKRWLMRLASTVLRRTWLFSLGGKLARWTVPHLPRWMVYHRLNPWGRQRELPPFPRRSFREQYRRKNRGQ
ncbi:MAG: 4Fe-4S ferredoxin [Planctomycetes bacterium RBG_16_64_10]|nr:MAG: 4Fe-4S ferredoxin [Planctomycetes bacterium RBG_16_64_10]